ncbi:MAG: FHA domain-containing protein [Ectothiorhodospiraceae bacterium]|nr:FHA domain-containing protein [Ectothiorhodospiraceae bacterium]
MLREDAVAPLQLRVDGEMLVFETPAALDFALRGRVGVPPRKLRVLSSLSDSALIDEIEAIALTANRFEQVLASPLGREDAVVHFLEILDLAAISQDHGWRTIITALRDHGSLDARFGLIALECYAEYLAARRDCLALIHQCRIEQRVEDFADGPGITDESPRRATLQVAPLASGQVPGFSRLPKGETVEYHLERGQILALLLAGHRVRIEHRGRLVLVDERQAAHPLRNGRNLVGREPACDVVLPAEFRDISRKHLIIETDGQSMVQLTDISSQGSAIPCELLEDTGV